MSGFNQDDFMRAASAHMMEQFGDLGSFVPGMNAPGAVPPGFAPQKITKRLKREIAALPPYSDDNRGVWFVYIDEEFEADGTGMTCLAMEVGKEEGSNGQILGESDGIGMQMAMCLYYDHKKSHQSQPPLVLGTVAKACLNPCAMSAGLFRRVGGSAAGMADEMLRPQRPRKILLQNQGLVELVRQDLADMGIHEVGVADSAIQKSLELHSASLNMMDGTTANMMPNADLSDPSTVTQMASGHIQESSQAMYEPYVSEEVVPLRGWRPPNAVGTLPRSWYARPPDDRNNYRCTALLGWRTNLERAVLRADAARIEQIVQAHDAADIREFVECRMLLTKMAQKGMVESCEALIDLCGASVEGAQAPDAEQWWLAIQNESGNYESLTPLHQACRNGQLEVVKLLLTRGADVNRIDKAKIRGSALHHAVSTGQIDIVRILCEHGADLRYEGMGGDALDISELCGGQEKAYIAVQSKVQEILREFDTRCSFCRAENPSKNCPCGKEKYW